MRGPGARRCPGASGVKVRTGEHAMGDRTTAASHGVVLVPQGNGLATALTASENVQVPLLLHGTEPREAARRTGRGAVVVMSTHDPEAAAACDGELALDLGVATWVRALGHTDA